MKDDIFALLKELSDAPGPVGREEGVQEIIRTLPQTRGLPAKSSGNHH